MPKNDIRVTYAVDRQTVASLDELAKRWGVSKSEAVRRAVRQARERVDAHFSQLSPLEALEYGMRHPSRSQEEAEEWMQETRAIRQSWGEDSDTP